MKIVVCMKETPSTTAEKRFGPDMRLERRKEDAIINPFDEYTIEEGLRQQEKHGGEVIVLCMGPATATDTIRKALAMGADSGVLVSDDALAGLGRHRHGARAGRRAARRSASISCSSAAPPPTRMVASSRAPSPNCSDMPLLSFATKLDIDGVKREDSAAGRGWLQRGRGGDARARQRRQVDQRAALPLDEGHHAVEEEAHRHLEPRRSGRWTLEPSAQGRRARRRSARRRSPQRARARSTRATTARPIASSPSSSSRRCSSVFV